MYDTYYLKGAEESDSTYNRNCPTGNASSVSGRCSSNGTIEKQWKEAYYCGKYNKYEVNRIIKKALDNIEPHTRDLRVITCVSATVYNKEGLTPCLNFFLTWWVIYLSGLAGDLDTNEQKALADSAVKQQVGSFNSKQQCPHYY